MRTFRSDCVTATAARALPGALVAALTLAAFTTCPSARADSPPPAVPPADLQAARVLFHESEADEQAGRWADALLKLRRASTVKMTPGLRFHIALCEEKLGHLVSALSSYRAAQDAARAENNREVLQLVAEPILALKIRMPTLTVNVPKRLTALGVRTEVRLDGAALVPGTVGTPVPVDVGSHTVQARAPGQTPCAITITVVERQAATVDVELLPLPGSALPAPVVAPNPSVPVQTLESPTVRRDATGKPSSIALKVVVTVSAVALVAGGFGAYAAAGSDQSYWDGVCKSQGTGCGNKTPVRAWDATALTAWVAGAGAGVLAVVLWASPSPGGFRPESAHAELQGGPGSLSFSGTF